MAVRRPKTLSEAISHALDNANKCYEREPSTRDLSVREMRYKAPHHIFHRFGVRDGLSVRDLMMRGLSSKNPLYERLIKKAG